MTRCFVVRHGETEWNLAHRHMGHLDSPLSAAGIAQACSLGRRLEGLGAVIVYTSDLGRAVSTAEIIANRCGLQVVKDSRLRERDLGIFAGMTKEEMRDRHPPEFEAFARDSFEYVIPGGESGRQRTARSVAAMEDLAGRHQRGCFVAVTHSGFLKGFFEHVTRIPPGQPWRYQLDNASFNAFVREEGRWSVETWNDTSHLDQQRPRVAAR